MFLAFEGIDGCGKGSQIQLLANFIKEHSGYEPAIVRDPGTSPLSVELRKLLLDKTLEMDALQQTLLFVAARSALAKQIRELLKDNKLVIADRWLCSTVMYQHHMGSVSLELIRDLHRAFCQNLHPDCYIILNVPAEVAAERKLAALRAAGQEDRFESHCDGWHRDLAKHYALASALTLNTAVAHVSAVGTIAQTFRLIVRSLVEACPQFNRHLVKSRLGAIYEDDLSSAGSLVGADER